MDEWRSREEVLGHSLGGDSCVVAGSVLTNVSICNRVWRSLILQESKRTEGKGAMLVSIGNECNSFSL